MLRLPAGFEARSRDLASTADRMTVYGATSSVPRVPAKVPRLNGQGTFSLGRGNASSCPISDPHDGGLGLPHLHRERSWVGW